MLQALLDVADEAEMRLQLGAIFGTQYVHDAVEVFLNTVEDGCVPGERLSVFSGIAIEAREHTLERIERIGRGRHWRRLRTSR